MKNVLARGLVCVSLAIACTGCFTVNHKLPEHTYFGKLPIQAGETVQSFQDSSMKNWLLAGFIPWSRYSTNDLLAEQGPAPLRYQNLEVQTQFNWLDEVIWVVPGQYYGYYVWAPRHISVSGEAVRSGAAAR